MNQGEDMGLGREDMKEHVVLLAVLMTIGGLGAVACGASAPATEAPALPTVAPASTPEPATATEPPAATPVPSTVTEEPAVAEPEPLFDGDALLQERCTACHDLGRVESASKTADEWRKTIERMIGKGARLNDAEKEALIEFLAGL